MSEAVMESSRMLADTSIASLKVPPHSIEAEQSVLGGLMLENRAWDDVSERVTENDFYRREHRLIFRVITQLAEQSEPFDVITISEHLDKLNELHNVGGLQYLGQLASNTPSASNTRAYADIVRERSVLRQMITVAHGIADSAFNPEGRSSTELLDDAERKVFEIAEMGAKQGGPQNIRSLLAITVDRIDELYRNPNAVTGVSTGFTDLDEMTAGLQKSDLVIVAGRPSMGKTTFAMTLCENILIKSGKPVLVFSLEMPGDGLVMRMLASLGRIDQTRLRRGQLEDEDWPRFNSAISLLAEQKLFIDDTPGLTPVEMRARARRIAREHGELGLIMVDYLQLMRVGGAESRVAEIGEISRSLKMLAKEMSCPVIALSQLNRGLEQRPNKRPVMSDLRESGAIEQDADLIMFIYRDEVYNPDSPDKGTAEIIIGKQRNGPIGTIRVAFLGKFSKFEDLAPESYGNYSKIEEY